MRATYSIHLILLYCMIEWGTQDNIASIVTKLQAKVRGVQIPAGAQDCLLLQTVQTAYGVHPVS
jgi:hypothetical protein